MSAPLAAPTIEILTGQDQIAILNARIEKLEAIINLYINPLEYIFSNDVEERNRAIETVERSVKRKNNLVYELANIFADLEDIKTRLGIVEHRRKPGTITEKRLKRTDDLLVARKNMPIPFAEMGKLQDFKPRYRDQDMTKLGHIYEEYPDRYDIRDSRLGGKTIKLVGSYYKHLTKSEVLAC